VRDPTPEQLQEAEAQLKLIELGWGNENSAFRQLHTSQLIPDATPEQARALNDLMRQTTTPANAAKLLRAIWAGTDNRSLANLYLVRNKPTYIGDELELANARQFGPWSMLTEALRTGQPQSGARGTENYRAYYADSVILENVARGMTGGSLRAAQAMAARFPWQEYRTLIDIGASQGCLPVQIALAHPHLRGGGFDLPALKPLFEAYVGQHGVADRVRFHPGDFFNDPLPTADVLVMGRVLHNWDFATKMLLLKKAYDALPEGGVLIVYERFIDDGRRFSTAGLLASLNMLVLTAGGFDYSAADCKGWMAETGFRDVRLSPLTAEIGMIAARK
jgi:precorrin-6B methylase 2